VGKTTRAFQGIKAYGILGPKKQREVCQAGLSKGGEETAALTELKVKSLPQILFLISYIIPFPQFI